MPASGQLWKLVLALAFNKRVAYEYEREWRAAIYQERRIAGHGVDIPTDLASLIDAVYVGPHAQEVDMLAARLVLGATGVDKPVTKSTLLTRP